MKSRIVLGALFLSANLCTVAMSCSLIADNSYPVDYIMNSGVCGTSVAYDPFGDRDERTYYCSPLTPDEQNLYCGADALPEDCWISHVTLIEEKTFVGPGC